MFLSPSFLTFKAICLNACFNTANGFMDNDDNCGISGMFEIENEDNEYEYVVKDFDEEIMLYKLA